MVGVSRIRRYKFASSANLALWLLWMIIVPSSEVVNNIRLVESFLFPSPASTIRDLHRTADNMMMRRRPSVDMSVTEEEEEKEDAIEEHGGRTFPIRTRRRDRRDFLQHSLAVVMGGASVLTTALVPSRTTTVAHAVVMDSNIQTVFEVGKDLTAEQALERLREGRQSLQYLVDHYDEICDGGGGDNVRRYLGTVGVGSGLYGIAKVLKVLQRSDNVMVKDDDIVEWNELADELVGAINRADGSAYMANFATFSSGSTPPKKFLDDAKADAKVALRIMDELSKQVKLK